MSTLGNLRAEVRDALEGAGLPALDREPARIAPPVALVSPGSPYLEAADAFGRRLVRVRVRLVVPSGDTATDALDEFLEAAVLAIESIGEAADEDTRAGDSWNVLEAGEPYTLLTGSVSYPATDLIASTTAYL